MNPAFREITFAVCFSGQSNRSKLSLKVSKWSQLASELNPTMIKFHSKFIQNEHV